MTLSVANLVPSSIFHVAMLNVEYFLNSDNKEEQNGAPPIPTSDNANDNESTGDEGSANGDA
jgi:hypothetical protein